MLRTTVGQLLVNEALPPDLRDHTRVLDKGGIQRLFQEIAERHPEQYREIAQRLSHIGHEAAYASGGMSFGLRDMQESPAAAALKGQLQHELMTIQADRSLSDDEKEKRTVDLLNRYQKPLEDAVYQESVAAKNPLALQIVSGTRGSKMNLKSLKAGDLLYTDHRDRPIPIPVLNSYSKGLSPVHYWAGSYGARKGVLDVKQCLSEGTLVRMADFSVKPIEQIQPGDMILGANFGGHLFPVQVLHRFDNGLRRCYEYRFRVSSTTRFVTLTATDDHKILAEIRDSKPGHAPYQPALHPLGEAKFKKDPTKNTFVGYPSRGYVAPHGKHEPLALLYGLLLGDGGTTDGWVLSCGDQTLVDDIGDYLETFALGLTPPSVGYGWTLHSKVRWPFQRAAKGKISGSGNPHLNRLTELGVRHLAHEKYFADEVWSWDQQSVAAVLAGLFSADSCIESAPRNTSIRLYLTSKPLAEMARELLEVRFGVWCGMLRHIPVRPGSSMKNDQWGFNVSHQQSVRRFCEQIALVGVKRLELEAAVARVKPQPRNACLGFKCVSKTEVGQVPTYDLEVDYPDHLFVLANGLIVSNSTADAGYFSKQLIQATHRLIATKLDEDKPAPDADTKGYPVPADDPDNEGALLAREAGGYPRNTVLTPRVLKHLREQGVTRLLLRSPIVGGPPEGGVYARDAGVRERGGLPPIGDYIGIAASQGLSEKLTQSQLSSKHSGGVAGAGAAVSGFRYIDLLVNPPKHFPGGATHAQLDGTVSKIQEQPQGGWQVTVGGVPHYVPADRPLKVTLNQPVEAGDALSEGIPNPAEIVKHKGVGEGRRYFIDLFRQAYANSGMGANRRNIELLARGLIDHVRLTDEIGDWVPGDVVPYSAIARTWEPRPGAVVVSPRAGLGKYLESPVLHHSVGTKLQPSMLKDLDDFGIKQVMVHPEPPPFEPVMVRGMSTLSADPDWMTRHLGSGLQKATLDAVHRSMSSDTAGTSFVPALAGDPVNFGVKGLTKGWKPDEKKVQ